MATSWLNKAEGLVSRSYLDQGQQALRKRHNLVSSLLSQRKLPAEGWDDASIEMFLQELSAMDSNNFLSSAGMGEREARCASELVRRRHFGMAHGIGRSGNISDEQPKAAGSTLAARITNFLVADALRTAGLADLKQVTVLPVATGMALTLCLLALRRQLAASAEGPQEDKTQAGRGRFVLWPRIDQKTCLKCVQAAGLDLVVVENCLEADEVRTDMERLEREIVSRGRDSIACVLSTTSCFAPRAPDKVEEIAKMCAKYGIPHIINNAYGVQSAATCQQITAAARRGRVDAVVCSTDKNFLVPVGGAVVACLGSSQGQRNRGRKAMHQKPNQSKAQDLSWSQSQTQPQAQSKPLFQEQSQFQSAPQSKQESLVDAVNATYPGRASLSPLLDVLITLLSLGKPGWQRLLTEREDLYKYTAERLRDLAARHQERLLETSNNPISLAITLASLAPREGVGPPSHPRHVTPGLVGPTQQPETSGEGPRSPPDAWSTEGAGSGCGRESTSAEQAREDRGVGPEASRSHGSSGAQHGSWTSEIRGVPLSGAASERLRGHRGPGTASTFPPLSEAPDGDSLPKNTPSSRDDLNGGFGKDQNQGGKVSSAEAILQYYTGSDARHQRPGCGVGHCGKDGALGLPLHQEGEDSGGESLGGEKGRQVTQAPSLTFLGSMLFSRLVSGCRVIPCGERKAVAGKALQGFGSSHSSYPVPYLTAAAAIGGSKADVDDFVSRLDKIFKEFRMKRGWS